MTTTINDMTLDELRAELRTAREVNRDFSTAATALAHYAREMKRQWDECRKSHDELYGIARQTEKDRDAAIARERAFTEGVQTHSADTIKRLQAELAEAKGRTFTLCGDDNCRDGKPAFIKDGSGKIIGVTTERHQSVLREGMRLAKLDHEELADAKSRCDELQNERNAAVVTMNAMEQERDDAMARQRNDADAAAAANARCDIANARIAQLDLLLADQQLDLQDADALNEELCSRFVAVPEWVKLPWRAEQEDGARAWIVTDANRKAMCVTSKDLAQHIVSCVNAMGAKQEEVLTIGSKEWTEKYNQEVAKSHEAAKRDEKPGDRPVTRAEGQASAAQHMATMEARRDKSRPFRVGDKVRFARRSGAWVKQNDIITLSEGSEGQVVGFCVSEYLLIEVAYNTHAVHPDSLDLIEPAKEEVQAPKPIGPDDARARDIAEKHGMELTGEYEEPNGRPFVMHNVKDELCDLIMEPQSKERFGPRYIVRPKAKEGA